MDYVYLYQYHLETDFDISPDIIKVFSTRNNAIKYLKEQWEYMCENVIDAELYDVKKTPSCIRISDQEIRLMMKVTKTKIL